MSKTKIINVVNDYSLDIYDALTNKKLKVGKLYELMLLGDKNKIEKLNKIDNKNKQYLMSKYTKIHFLDELLNLLDNCFSHLKDARKVVNIDNLVEFVFTEEIFLAKIRVNYTYKIIDLILEDYYNFEDIKMLSKYKEEAIDIERNINAKIIKRIHEYYIKMITN